MTTQTRRNNRFADLITKICLGPGGRGYKNRKSARAAMTQASRRYLFTPQQRSKLEEEINRHLPAATTVMDEDFDPVVEVVESDIPTHELAVDVVPFQGATVLALMHNDIPHAPIRRFTEILGIDFSSQYQKLKDLKWARMVVITIPDLRGHMQKMVCMPVDRIPMWLVTIDANRVRNDIRPILEAMQDEVQQVIADHFAKKKPDATTEALGLTYEVTNTATDQASQALVAAARHLESAVTAALRIPDIPSISLPYNPPIVTMSTPQEVIGRLERRGLPEGHAHAITWVRRLLVGDSFELTDSDLSSISPIFINRFIEHYGVAPPRMENGRYAINGVSVRGAHQFALACMPNHYGVWLLSLLQSRANGHCWPKSKNLVWSSEGIRASNEYTALCWSGEETPPLKLKDIAPIDYAHLTKGP